VTNPPVTSALGFDELGSFEIEPFEIEPFEIGAFMDRLLLLKAIIWGKN
jgi:hypothetical protein